MSYPPSDVRRRAYESTAAMTEADKIMFEIFRQAGPAGRFRVVYYTELDEHERDRRIGEALAGEHVFDGFMPDYHAERGKCAIAALIARLNAGEELSGDSIHASLAAFLTA